MMRYLMVAAIMGGVFAIGSAGVARAEFFFEGLAPFFQADKVEAEEPAAKQKRVDAERYRECAQVGRGAKAPQGYCGRVRRGAHTAQHQK